MGKAMLKDDLRATLKKKTISSFNIFILTLRQLLLFKAIRLILIAKFYRTTNISNNIQISDFVTITN